jgi:integration host factor subunit alpha
VANLTKTGIIEAVRDSGSAHSNAEAAEIVDAFFEVFKDALAQAEKLKITGFGTFNTREKKARTGRNPQTGEPIEISARRVLSFKASDQLKKKMNSQGE